MLIQVILLLISSLALSQDTAVKTDNPPKPYEDAEAYEVYSAIIPTGSPWQVQNAKSLVIRRESKGYKMCLRPEGESEKIIGQAIKEYVKLSGKTWLIQQRLNIEKPYELIAYDELKPALKQAGWENFYKQYPNSGGYWIELSAVGFNADKTVAVVYMEHRRSGFGLGSGGKFHVLQKQDGKWAPLKWKGRGCNWES
jgi:hypothetical protein